MKLNKIKFQKYCLFLFYIHVTFYQIIKKIIFDAKYRDQAWKSLRIRVTVIKKNFN